MPIFFEHENEKSASSAKDETDKPLAPKISEAGEVKTLLTWHGPSRPFRQKGHLYYRTVAILAVLLILIALLAHEFLLVGTILAFIFVTYVLAFIPPSDTDYKISTQGVTIGDHFYFWHSLGAFWFKEKEGQKILLIQTGMNFPGQLMLVLGSIDPGSTRVDEEEVKRVVAKFLPFHEIPQTPLMEKWAEGLQKHFPLEKTS